MVAEEGAKGHKNGSGEHSKNEVISDRSSLSAHFVKVLVVLFNQIESNLHFVNKGSHALPKTVHKRTSKINGQSIESNRSDIERKKECQNSAKNNDTRHNHQIRFHSKNIRHFLKNPYLNLKG